ncbi:MAG: FMN-binding protein [Spirochaeta sp.]|jgi:Na+-transporting NADH:ubiquinone oxidoreductase subunit C|nr:FMN-binding protein [Spirochaeta sp.]
MNKQSLVYTIIFTFAVSFVFVLILSFANEGTREQVALNQTVARQRAILNALGVEYDGPQDVLAKFKNVEETSEGDITFYRTEVDGETVFAKEFSGSGLWGTINGILAVDADVSRTMGLEIISHNETPGLGGRIDEPWFKQQLRGEQIMDGSVEVAGAGDGDSDYDNGKIDAITGATRTSDSMQVILDRELSAIAGALGGNS